MHLRWARRLKSLGLAGLAGTLLASGGAFAALAAQGLYIGQPLVSPWLDAGELGELARLLENPGEAAAFIELLQGERA